MMLIFNLTLDQLQNVPNGKRMVSGRSIFGQIQIEQILTEQGICYITNNLLASHLSVK